MLSSDFVISRDTHQGCPLSPLLFVLAIEPLAQAIRLNPNIKGIPIGVGVKTNLFEGDLVLFITYPSCSLPVFTHL